MRNLSLLSTAEDSLAGRLLPSTVVSAVAFDLDEDALYAAAERQTEDTDVVVEVWKYRNYSGRDTGYDSALSEAPIVRVRSQAYMAANPWSSPFGRPLELVSFKLLPGTRALVFIIRGGEIATASLDDEHVSPDVVGNVDAGILAASWSPDDSLVALATGDDKLILMTSAFDIISESTLHKEDFGEDAPIDVGWGSKQTQFHGTLGKAAAQVPRPAVIGSSPDDDELPRISWRGDGAFFVVSTLSPKDPNDPSSSAPERRGRTIRTYSHAGVLQSTSEPTPGLEHVLSWRPSGNWIVSTQRYGFVGGGEGREGRHDVVMFERNGLRRLDFGIEFVAAGEKEAGASSRKWRYRVKEAAWSSDSNILSLWIEKDKGDIVQLWTVNNYHWYLKHEINAPVTLDGQPGRFTAVTWHPENASTIVLTTPVHVIRRSYAWDTFASGSKPPNDSGSVAVLDGTSVLLTPFRTQNVPPPMSSFQLPLQLPPDAPKNQSRLLVHVAFVSTKDILIALWETGYVKVTDLHTRLGPGRGKVMDPLDIWTGLASDPPAAGRQYRQVLATSDRRGEDTLKFLALAADVHEDGKDIITAITLRGRELEERTHIRLPQRNGRLIPSEDRVWWQAPDGEILAVDWDGQIASAASSFPHFCPWSAHVAVTSGSQQEESHNVFIGLTATGSLFVSGEGGSHQTLAQNANSFIVSSGFLIFTTTVHVAQFTPLSALRDLLEKGQGGAVSADVLPQWETRRVERGSRIVTAVASTMSLVLQMPRGNLETVHPRPLVTRIVHQDIDNANYSKAFIACRKHRVDLNVFLEHNQQAFMGRLASFVEQVDDVDYINLFLTNIGQGLSHYEQVNALLDGVREELEKKDLKRYVNSILTAHVMKRPPDHEAGLALLHRLRETEPQLVEDAVKYIIFLVDADRLFDTALGMYDFSLVLLVAQHAQKDPREYLPFLRELRALDEHYQRFKIDDHLKRHEKALLNLSLAGSDRFDEAMAYVEKHRLYDAALATWTDTDRYSTVLNVYGDWLFERREFPDAAFVFRKAGGYAKAMLAYEKALDWQMLFDVAVQQQKAQDDIVAIAYRIAEDLSSKKRYQESARVLLDYVKDVRQAVISLVQGNMFSESRRIIALYSCPELLGEIVYPGALDSRAQIAEDLHEMKEQLRKQVARLCELRIKKVEEPDVFYGQEDMDLHNVDVMTDVSMAPTMFTRYTAAPSAMSKSSKRSSRSKRKMERKVGSGRKGTVDEEEYLLKSITKLVGRFNGTLNDGIQLLSHLFQFTDGHREEGEGLQDELDAFAQELKAALEEVWKRPEDAEGETTLEGWATRMQEYQKQRQIDPLLKVARPDLAKYEWNKKLSRIGDSGGVARNEELTLPRENARTNTK